MENIVFERDYTAAHEKAAQSRSADILQEAISGGFLKNYNDALAAIPKVIVPEYRENYEYLLQVCDHLAKQWGGSVRGVVDYTHWEATIDLTLPCVEFTLPDELSLLRDMAEKAHAVSFQPVEGGGICIHLYNLYFEDLVTDEHRAYIEYDSLMKDEKLSKMLGLSKEPSSEAQDAADLLKCILDTVEEATGQDRTAIWKEIARQADGGGENIRERMEQMIQEILEEGTDGLP